MFLNVSCFLFLFLEVQFLFEDLKKDEWKFCLCCVWTVMTIYVFKNVNTGIQETVMLVIKVNKRNGKLMPLQRVRGCITDVVGT